MGPRYGGGCRWATTRPTVRAMHWYRAYGLTVASELELPELEPSEPGTADVRLSLGGVPAELADPAASRLTWTSMAGETLHEVEGVGRFHVSAGAEIRVEVHGSEQDARAFLFGTALGALLHQRGWLTLQASSAARDGRAIVVAGDAGVGKSTTLATLVDRGCTMVADDKTVVFSRAGRVMTAAGYPTMRLWRRALAALDRDADALQPVREDIDQYLLRAPGTTGDPVEIGVVIVLEVGSGPDLEVERLGELEAFEQIVAKTYRPELMRGVGGQHAHFGHAVALAGQAPVFRVTRPRGVATLAPVADAVLAAEPA